MSGVLRRWAVLTGALTQVGLSVGLFAGTDRPFEPPPGGPSPAEPAGYAFSIWGPIFLGAIAFAIHQLRPSQKDDPVLARIGWPVAIGFFATGLWLVFARFGPLWATVPAIATILVGVGYGFVEAARAEPTRSRRWLVVAPLGLFTGWVTAATFVNVAEVLPGFGFDRFGMSPGNWAIWGVLLPAFVVTLAFLERTRWSLVYAGAVAWALVAIAAANFERGFGPAVPAVAVTLLAGLAIAVVAGKLQLRRRSDPVR